MIWEVSHSLQVWWWRNWSTVSSHPGTAHQHECPEELVSDKYLNFDEIIAISAKTNHKVDAVKEAIRNVLDKHALKQVEENIEKENERKKNRLHWYWK